MDNRRIRRRAPPPRVPHGHREEGAQTGYRRPTPQRILEITQCVAIHPE